MRVLMVLRITQALARQFGAVVTLAVLIGLGAPGIAAAFSPALMPEIMCMFALSFMIANTDLLRAELANWRQLSWLMIFVAVLRGVLAFGVARLLALAFGLPPSSALPVGLLYACPPAGITPTLALLFGARFERTIFATTMSTLLAPLVIVGLLAILVGGSADVELHIDALGIAGSSGLVILLPLAVAIVVRRFFPAAVEGLRPYAPGLSTAILFALLIGAFGVAASATSGGAETTGLDLESLARPALFMGACMLVVAGAGALAAGPRAAGQDRMSYALLCAWPNIGLALVLGQQLFGEAHPQLLTLLAASALPWALALGPARWLASRAQLGVSKTAASSAP